MASDTNNETIKATMLDRILLLKLPLTFEISFNDRNIFLTRNVEYKTPPFRSNTQITIGRRNLTSIRLDEGPDFRAAALIGLLGGIATGIGGMFMSDVSTVQ